MPSFGNSATNQFRSPSSKAEVLIEERADAHAETVRNSEAAWRDTVAACPVVANNGLSGHVAVTSALPLTADFSSPDVRFHADFVCFTLGSGPSCGPCRTSAADPFQTFVALGAYLNRTQF